MKNLITVCLFLLAANLHSQILNPSFEEWEFVNVFGFDYERPKDWHVGFVGELAVKLTRDAYEGNHALRIFGRTGLTDNPIPGKIQQQLKIPFGLDSISFYAKMDSTRIFIPQSDFYGYGLYKDSITSSTDLKKMVVGKTSKDSIIQYKRLSYIVPDSLWGRNMYLTFYSQPIGWESRNFTIDDIQLHGDFSVNTQNIDNQQFSIFPNPTEDWLFIKNENLNFSIIEIFSPEGKLIFSEKGKDKINVERLPSGNYFLVLKDKSREVLGSEMFIKN